MKTGFDILTVFGFGLPRARRAEMVSRRQLAVVCGAALAGFALSGRAQPTNDNFASAIVVTGSSWTTTAANAGATKEPGEPNHAGNAGGASIWWVWTAPANGLVSLNTSANANFDTLLAVYTGSSVSNLTLVAADDDSGVLRSSALTFSAYSNTAYHFAVDGYNGATGRVQLMLLLASPAAPTIKIPPVSQAAGIGGMAAFQVGAIGFGSLTYQWQNTNGLIAGATNSNLVLANLGAKDAGGYSVAVGNAFGSLTSSVASLVVSGGVPVTTWSGAAPTPGYVDARGRAARFNSPGGIAVDNAGNAYVADSWNHAIRKIAPDGSTTTLAGGVQGAADGFGTNAEFDFPSAVAVDGVGNVYVADESNNAIRMITPGGQVTTVAGLPGDKNAGFNDGSGASARFNHPSGLAVDGQGNIYVADTWNQVIRMVTPDGIVTTLAGTPRTQGYNNGTATNALFSFPTGIALDQFKTLYVCDTRDCVIRVVTTNGVVSTLAGRPGFIDGADGQGTNGHFAFPEGLAVDGLGNVFVADTGNDTIRKISPDGTVTTICGQAGLAEATDGSGTNALFYTPTGVGLTGDGRLFVTERGNNSIRVIDTNQMSGTWAGPGGSAGSDNGPGPLARLNYPAAVAVDASNNVYAADLLNYVVRKIASDGTVSVLAGQAGRPGSLDGAAGNALFASPAGVAVDGAGTVYVTDMDNQTIRMITNGTVSTLAGSSGKSGSADGTGTNAFFFNPSGIAADILGNVYVADSSNHTVRVITPAGVVSTLAGRAGKAGSTNGSGTNAMFSSPSAVAVDALGNVYVADKGNEMIRMIAPGGAVTTLAGVAGKAGNADGPATSAMFSSMAALAVDSTGNVYVADTYNNTIRMISSAGVVTTLDGVPGLAGSSDGGGTGALFFNPAGIAVSHGGLIYVADTLNNTIRVGTPNVTVSPLLQITGLAGQVILSWPGSSAGFVLQTTPSLLTPVTWATVTSPPAMAGGAFVVTNTAANRAGFFRLSSP